jgi:hypothetical protein
VDLLRNHLLILGIDYEKWSSGSSPLSEDEKKDLDQLVFCTTIGAQSLAIRGSEKSLYGKFFEKLILGSVLSVLGFKFSETQSAQEGTFWLSQTDKRESDATVLWSSGKAVRLDIGFIGAGNSEITLDKVSRFSKHIEISGKQIDVTTVVIVDRVGTKSAVISLANDIDAHVVQMSNDDWVKELSEIFEATFKGYISNIPVSSDASYSEIISQGVNAAPLENIFKVAVASSEDSDVEEGLEED